MIGKLNHVAIAVPDLEHSINIYRNTLGAVVSNPIDQVAHGVRVVFIQLPNTKIELITPLGVDSPVTKFLERNPIGGIHHICYEVTHIHKACDQLVKNGAKIIGDGVPKNGAHGKPVVFLNPKDFDGTLIELEEI